MSTELQELIEATNTKALCKSLRNQVSVVKLFNGKREASEAADVVELIADELERRHG